MIFGVESCSRLLKWQCLCHPAQIPEKVANASLCNTASSQPADEVTKSSEEQNNYSPFGLLCLSDRGRVQQGCTHIHPLPKVKNRIWPSLSKGGGPTALERCIDFNIVHECSGATAWCREIVSYRHNWAKHTKCRQKKSLYIAQSTIL